LSPSPTYEIKIVVDKKRCAFINNSLFIHVIFLLQKYCKLSQSFERIEQDYIIGSVIQDMIIPHAMSWFIDADFQDLMGDDGDGEVDDEEEDSKLKGFIHASLYSDDLCCFGKREHSRSRSPSPESASSSELIGEGTNSFGIPSILSEF